MEIMHNGWHIVIQSRVRGYFEKDFPNVGTSIEGMLALDGKLVTDFDGVFELPRSVVQGLRDNGFTFAHNVLPEDK